MGPSRCIYYWSNCSLVLFWPPTKKSISLPWVTIKNSYPTLEKWYWSNSLPATRTRPLRRRCWCRGRDKPSWSCRGRSLPWTWGSGRRATARWRSARRPRPTRRRNQLLGHLSIGPANSFGVNMFQNLEIYSRSIPTITFVKLKDSVKRCWIGWQRVSSKT